MNLVSTVRDINLQIHVPALYNETTQDDYTYEPLLEECTIEQHFQSTLDCSIDAQKTDEKSSELKHFSAIRYFNSHLSKRALINRIQLLHPELNVATINYGLGNRFSQFKQEQDPNLEQETIEKDWVRFKNSTTKGSSIAKLMNSLGLGRLVFKAKIQWSKLYDLTAANRILLVDHILAHPDIHQMLILNTNPPEVIQNQLPLQVAVDENPDALLNIQEDEEQLENVEDVQDVGMVFEGEEEEQHEEHQGNEEEHQEEQQGAEMEESVDEEEQESDKENEPSEEESVSSQVSEDSIDWHPTFSCYSTRWRWCWFASKY